MSFTLYFILDLSFFFVGFANLQRRFAETESFLLAHKALREEERQVLQLAGFQAIAKNLDYGWAFFQEREPLGCKKILGKRIELQQLTHEAIKTKKTKLPLSATFVPVLHKQNPSLRPSLWPNWVGGLRYLGGQS